MTRAGVALWLLGVVVYGAMIAVLVTALAAGGLPT